MFIAYYNRGSALYNGNINENIDPPSRKREQRVGEKTNYYEKVFFVAITNATTILQL